MRPGNAFEAEAAAALADRRLQAALADVPGGFASARERAKAAFPEFEALRRSARDIKDHTLANLDLYLEAFEANARANGTVVHWAPTAAAAADIILDICRATGARLVAKSKSMVSEEIGLSRRLEAAALEVIETDLGEYLVQIRGEAPSHIIAPAIHLGAADIEADFRTRHRHLAPERDLSSPEALVAEARAVLRPKFLAADVGITGANFLVAATGSAIVVTNEGNADLTMSLPKVHIVLASIEKVVPTLNDAFALLRLLARSATGQEITAYTTFATGPRRPEDADGPEACHVVLLDNGRSELLGSEFRAVLRCIRCGACMNVCPVYGAVGGHAYGSVYPGPIGAVLTPALAGARRRARPRRGLDVLRALRAGLPRRDPARRPHAPLARGVVCAGRGAGAAGEAADVGVPRRAPARLSRGGAPRRRDAQGAGAKARRAAAGFPLPPAGRARAIFPCRRGERSKRRGHGRKGGNADEPRSDAHQDPLSAARRGK